MKDQKGSKWGGKLKSMQSGWKQSSSQYDSMFGASDIPEDVYVLKLQECKLGESDGGGIYVRREHVVLEGDHKGVVIGDVLMLSTETGPVYVRRWLKMLEIEIPENLEDLEELLAELKDAAPVVKARVTQSSSNDGRQFTNVRILSVLGDDGEELEEEGAEGDDDLDLAGMTLKELRAFVKENELEIEKYLKLGEEDLRAAITELISEDTEGEEGEEAEPEAEPEAEGEADEIDFDSMEAADLAAFIEENEISCKDLGYVNKLKMKKASVKELRAKLQELVGGVEEGEEAEPEGAEGADDEAMEMAKLFCGTWDVNLGKDADLDDIKKAISACKFPEAELDEDEVTLLTELGLESTIEKAKAKPKFKGKLKK